MAVASVPQMQPPAVVAALPACAAPALSIFLDGEDGAFAGMSHDGALLVVRNIGTEACRLPGLPVLRFEDVDHRPLPIEREVPPGMHPGPVILPVGLAAGAAATAGLRWADTAVFGDDGGRCFAPARVVVTFGGTTATAPVSIRICGPAGQPADFEQKVLAPDPVLRP